MCGSCERASERWWCVLASEAATNNQMAFGVERDRAVPVSGVEANLADCLWLDKVNNTLVCQYLFCERGNAPVVTRAQHSRR